MKARQSGMATKPPRDMVRPTEPKDSFVERVAKQLPSCVPLGLRRRLAGQAFDLACAPDRDVSDAQLAREARLIANAAARFAGRVDVWCKSAGTIALDTRGSREQLTGPVFVGGEALTDDEQRLAFAGMDRFALRTVLLGLQVHLQVCAIQLSRAGAPRAWRTRAIEALVIGAFEAQVARAGKPARANKGDWWSTKVMEDTLQALLREVHGVEHDGDRVDRQLKRARQRRRQVELQSLSLGPGIGSPD